MRMIENFEQMLVAGKDTPLLRFSLGNAYLQVGDHIRAITHLTEALAKDQSYSAAWKLLGKAYSAAGDDVSAIKAYSQGITAATLKGDKQAAREMVVFLRRLQN